MEKRILFVDQLKAFAILLVILGHVMQNYFGIVNDNVLHRIIYSFHMPLFMFLSGYCCYKKNSWSLVKRRFKQLVIPFLFYTFISATIFCFNNFY